MAVGGPPMHITSPTGRRPGLSSRARNMATHTRRSLGGCDPARWAGWAGWADGYDGQDGQDGYDGQDRYDGQDGYDGQDDVCAGHDGRDGRLHVFPPLSRSIDARDRKPCPAQGRVPLPGLPAAACLPSCASPHTQQGAQNGPLVLQRDAPASQRR